ncbi:hypothetical protein RMCBS344292_16192 [Rhizopus microsporus]|nr:hypothetical protein RMCBS344292_16192 [Rhizopus microsporus]
MDIVRYQRRLSNSISNKASPLEEREVQLVGSRFSSTTVSGGAGHREIIEPGRTISVRFLYHQGSNKDSADSRLLSNKQICTV